MNGLVAYGSSSDDETDARPLSQRTTLEVKAVPVSGAVTDDSGHVSDGLSNAGAETKMVGPVMPTEEFGSASIEDLNDLPSNMSEQDLVRHLTQASHPMRAIPPSPPGSPDPATDARVQRFLDLKVKGLHFNEDLAKKNSFRNPALFSNLAERAGLTEDEQCTTSIPPSVTGFSKPPPFAYKEELARSQQSIRDQQASRKKQASAAGKRTIDFATAGVSGTSSQTSTPGSQRK